MDRYKLVYTVPGKSSESRCTSLCKPGFDAHHHHHHHRPASHLTATKDAIFKTGAGVYEGGKYVQVAFELTGQGQFLPVAEAGAVPHTGSVGQLERLLEYRVEIMCDGRDTAKAAVASLKR